MTTQEHLEQALKVLSEFADDIEAVGISKVGEEWPDLLITYQKAVEILS